MVRIRYSASVAVLFAAGISAQAIPPPATLPVCANPCAAANTTPNGECNFSSCIVRSCNAADQQIALQYVQCTVNSLIAPTSVSIPQTVSATTTTAASSPPLSTTAAVAPSNPMISIAQPTASQSLNQESTLTTKVSTTQSQSIVSSSTTKASTLSSSTITSSVVQDAGLTSRPTTTTTAASASDTKASNQSSGNIGLKAGLGAALSCLVVVAALAILLLIRLKRRQKAQTQAESGPQAIETAERAEVQGSNAPARFELHSPKGQYALNQSELENRQSQNLHSRQIFELPGHHG